MTDIEQAQHEWITNSKYNFLLFYFRFCPSNDFSEISADDLWTLFSSTIEGLFDVEANMEIFEAKDYVSLLFSVSAAAIRRHYLTNIVIEIWGL